MAYCWLAEAAAVDQACCAADPVRCDTNDIVAGCDMPMWFAGESCAATLLETSNQCLADARVSKCDWRDEATSVRAYCWDQGISAKDACCAARPDWSCDEP